jgi:hypothetical protein
MIAGVYARKNTEQNVSEDAKNGPSAKRFSRQPKEPSNTTCGPVLPMPTSQ